MSLKNSAKEIQELESSLMNHMDEILQRAETLLHRMETFRRAECLDSAPAFTYLTLRKDTPILSYLSLRLDETMEQFIKLDEELHQLQEIKEAVAEDRGTLQEAVDAAFIEELSNRYAISSFDVSLNDKISTSPHNR